MEFNDLNKLFVYLKDVIKWRLQNPKADFAKTAPKFSLKSLEGSAISEFIITHELSSSEYITLLLALVPHLLPDYFLTIVSEEFPDGSDFPMFGGVKGKNHRGILPTGETVLFILGGSNLKQRVDCFNMFQENHIFHKEQIMYLEGVPAGEPAMSGKLNLFPDCLFELTTGEIPSPKLSTDFPAEKLETELIWNDLVLNDKTLAQIQDLEIWLEYNEIVMKDWGMNSRIKDGYRALFHGPSGTGKTLTATLLGKFTGKPVYRIDLSTVVSKYIGETEKNLSNLFNKAANKDWILFFDEADAIFGKRTNVRDAHDKYANQEVSYLLQRIESHSGLVILASNFKDNIDDAFTRRFQAIVGFGMPGAKERKVLWEKNLPNNLKLDKEIDLREIARKYELSGSNIINIIHFCCLRVLSEKKDRLTTKILMEGIKKEFLKENRMF
ncbi:ATP-binding protein [Ulvibacter antarcticus]|uniref:ATPase family protein associated with various cellular activities (AAA) n=1 Tax=Ulvibacter antarcticus TaxID=442714 RepID=A0A3L9YI28_9FLAO|nr:ATP-binding protein [Ulvibacter antarcticus]RMA58859.1 ATPase family protein associated with various cellular activities (AAA) [Ulvibacter antarcticus]